MQSLWRLPLACYILGLGAPVDLFRFCSCVAQMPAYSSVVCAVRRLSKNEADITLEFGRQPHTVGRIWLDNVQNYIIHHNPGIGCVNELIIGIAATFYEVKLEKHILNAFDLNKKAFFGIDGTGQATFIQTTGDCGKEDLSTI